MTIPYRIAVCYLFSYCLSKLQFLTDHWIYQIHPPTNQHVTSVLSSFVLSPLWCITLVHAMGQTFLQQAEVVLLCSIPMATSLLVLVFDLAQFVRWPHSHLCERTDLSRKKTKQNTKLSTTLLPSLFWTQISFPTLLRLSLAPTFPSPTPNTQPTV